MEIMNKNNSPKKVLYVHHGSGQGGAAVSLITLIKNIDRTRYLPILACDFRLNKVEAFFSISGVKLVDIKINPFVHTTNTWCWYTPRGFIFLVRWLLFGYWKTKKCLKGTINKERPSIVHLNGMALLPYSKLVCRFGVPLVQHIRDPIHPGTFGIRKKILCQYAKKYVSRIISISSENAKNFLNCSAKTDVLYNPVQLKILSESHSIQIRESLFISKDEVVLFFPGGSFLHQKGILVFLTALSSLAKSSHSINFKALIPGMTRDVNPRDTIRYQANKIIAENGLETMVIRVPFINSVEDYYSISDIVITPFIVAHFSRAVIEAGVMGKSVIASRIDVIREVLDDGVNGLLVTPNDPGDLANKIVYLAKNPKIRAKMGANGLKRAAKYNPVEYGYSIMNIYDQVLEAKIGTPDK